MGDLSFTVPLLLGLVLLWVPAVFWIVTLVIEMVGGETDSYAGALGIGVALALAAVAFTSHIPWVLYGASFALWASAIAAPAARKFLAKRAHLMIDLEQMRKYSTALAASPTNLSALSDLGKFCAKFGLQASAIALLERAVANAPRYTAEEKRMIQWLRRGFEGEPADHPISCPNCHTQNAPDAVKCKNCGAAILVLLAGGHWMPESAPGKLLRIWVLVIAVVFLAPAIGASVSSALAVPLILAVVAAAAFLLWRIVVR